MAMDEDVFNSFEVMSQDVLRSLGNSYEIEVFEDKSPLYIGSSRTLLVRNLDRNARPEDIFNIFSKFGTVAGLETRHLTTEGFVVVTFHDLRDSCRAHRSITFSLPLVSPGIVQPYSNVGVHYFFQMVPDRELSERNEGKILLGSAEIFNMSEIKEICSKFGETRKIVLYSNSLYLIEYFDLKCSEYAYRSLSKISTFVVTFMSGSTSWELAGYGYEKKHEISNNFHGIRSTSSTSIFSEGSSNATSPSSSRSTSPIPFASSPPRLVASSPQMRDLTRSDKFQINLDAIAKGLDIRTTLMIKNIPNKYTQDMLLEFLDQDHKGLYDFIYLPIDFKNKCNMGYSFINFINPRSIISFTRKAHGKKWTRFNSEKVCQLSYARIQGKESLIRHFQNSTIMSEEKSYQPKIFYSNGPMMGLEQKFPDSKLPESFHDHTLCCGGPAQKNCPNKP